MKKVALDNFSFYEPSAAAKITFTEIEKGTSIPSHHHEKDVCNFLASGKLLLTVGAKEELIEKGSWFEIKKGE
jgi:quercetin dioxygenase-like cupin family protein